MIEYMETKSNVPKFYISQNLDGFDLIINDHKFHDRIVDFIIANIEEGQAETLLCYFIHETGDIQSAELPKVSYKQSILKSLKFYTFHEKYERCAQIKKLLKKL